MQTSTSIRLTSSGACASCGAYGLSQHQSTCQPGVVRRFKRGLVRFYDSRVSAAMRDRSRLEDEAVRAL